MMESIMESAEANRRLVGIANAILHGEMNLIEGCRIICSLRYETSKPDHSAFLPIRAIESETDHYPVAENRSQYAPEYLRRVDAEMEGYLVESKHDILAACRELVQVFGWAEAP